jgi:hypothetical protein
MASQAYYDWMKAGKPYTRSKPVLQTRDVIRGHGYTVYDYPNEDHQKAEPPEDHTAYSATGWPITSKRWVGHAIDIMPDGDIPVTLPKLARQIIADKDAGVPGTKWLKYINWTDENGACWQVSWKPTKKIVKSTDKGHIHMSGRSDMDDSSEVIDSGWDPVRRAAGMAIQDVNLYRGRSAPPAVGTRGAGVQMDDVWAQEQLGHSAYDSDKSYRTKQLDDIVARLTRIEDILKNLAPGTGGSLSSADHEAIKNDVKNALREGTN